MNVGSIVLEAFPSRASMYVGNGGGMLPKGNHVSGKWEIKGGELLEVSMCEKYSYTGREECLLAFFFCSMEIPHVGDLCLSGKGGE